MAKRTKKKAKKRHLEEHSERRWRTARASLRMHDDLRGAVDFLAKSSRRTVSQVLEMLVVEKVRDLMQNEFSDRGNLVQPGEFKLKNGNAPMFR
jgi:predicted transcriptional regulator